jgi:membrane-bound ClpP family serine protease
MTTQISADGSTKRVALERCFEDVGWGVLLIAVGIIWLLPEKHVPRGSWLTAAGLIMLGLNAARFFSGIRIRGFSLAVGLLH